MSSVRRILAASLAVLLSLEAFSPVAWAQVAARTAPVPAGAVVSAGAVLGVPALTRGSLPLPSSAGLSLSPLALAAAPVPALARAALPAPAISPREKAAPEAGVSGRIAVLTESTASALEKVSSAASSRADLKRSGDDLEGILSGEPLRRPMAADGLSPAPETPRAELSLLPARTPEGRPASGPAASALPEISAHARGGFRLYSAGISTVKVGIEALNLVVPTLLLAQYGAATLVGALFLSAQLAGLVAG